MNKVYLDTNILVYSSQVNSPYYAICNKFIKHAVKNNIELTTSTESIQEIIHLAKVNNKISAGLRTAHILLKIVQSLLPVNKELINIYLELLKKNSHLKKLESRDFIHLASCFYDNIENIITYDKGFKHFKKIKSFTPDEYLSRLGSKIQ